MAKKNQPDELRNPTPHVAPKKTVVDSVLNGVLAAGNGLVTLMAGLLAGVLVLYSGYVIYDSFSIQYGAYSSAWDLLQYKPEFINDNQVPLNASELTDINEDYRAWLTMYDTSIDYPVLQGEDDLYYAWHNIYKESSLTGAIYLAARNSRDLSDTYNLIYGHHIDNGAMFGRLDSYRDEEYYNAHREGILVTSRGAFDIKLFAVISTDAYENRIYDVGNRRDEVIAFLNSGGEGGVGLGTEVLFYDSGLAASAKQLVALSTCASASTSGRLVVIGAMTRRDLIAVTVEGYEGEYDGKPHSVTATCTVEDATLEYSTDGENWSTEVPTLTDAGELAVRVRATSPVYGVAEDVAFLRVKPKEVTVTADDITKVFGEKDPELTVKVDGLIGDDRIDYTVTRKTGDEVGKYAIEVTGDADQGNYHVTYVSGEMTIGKGSLGLTVTAYDGPFDGKPHTVTATPTVTEGTKLEYSTDGGKTWTETPPSITQPGTLKVDVRASNPNLETVTASATIVVHTPSNPGGGGTTIVTPPANDPETTSVTITKQWANDTAADRPENVVMLLSGNNEYRAVVLSAANGWTATISNLPANVEYSWIEPSVTNYNQTSATTQDGMTTITNTFVKPQEQRPTGGGGRSSHTLIIRYHFLDGKQAAPTYTASVRRGDTFDVVSPTIEGYTAVPVRVTGTMPGRSVEYTVLYVPSNQLAVIEDYGTPLGFSGGFSSLGDCFE